ncbi:hypothetical protein E2320_007121, partial [Naja naja]
MLFKSSKLQPMLHYSSHLKTVPCTEEAFENAEERDSKGNKGHLQASNFGFVASILLDFIKLRSNWGLVHFSPTLKREIFPYVSILDQQSYLSVNKLIFFKFAPLGSTCEEDTKELFFSSLWTVPVSKQ